MPGVGQEAEDCSEVGSIAHLPTGSYMLPGRGGWEQPEPPIHRGLAIKTPTPQPAACTLQL